MHEIEIVNKTASELQELNPGIDIVISTVQYVNFADRIIYLSSPCDDSSCCSSSSNSRTLDTRCIEYQQLCICAGARPDMICEEQAGVMGIRDISSLDKLAASLRTASRVVIAGNGGIALELVHQLRLCSFNVDWVIKDDYVGNVFFDASASAFILPSLLARAQSYAVGDGGADQRHGSSAKTCSVARTGSTVAPASIASGSVPVSVVDASNSSAATMSTGTDAAVATTKAHEWSGMTGAAAGPDWLQKSSALKQLMDEASDEPQSGPGYLHVSVESVFTLFYIYIAYY